MKLTKIKDNKGNPIHTSTWKKCTYIASNNIFKTLDNELWIIIFVSIVRIKMRAIDNLQGEIE